MAHDETYSIGSGPPGTQVAITPADSDNTISELTDGKLTKARGLNVATAGVYRVVDWGGNQVDVYLTQGYNPCACSKVLATGSVSTSGVVACG
jgi:expansin (peptidoglycan-binding protein)